MHPLRCSAITFFPRRPPYFGLVPYLQSIGATSSVTPSHSVSPSQTASASVSGSISGSGSASPSVSPSCSVVSELPAGTVCEVRLRVTAFRPSSPFLVVASHTPTVVGVRAIMHDYRAPRVRAAVHCDPLPAAFNTCSLAPQLPTATSSVSASRSVSPSVSWSASGSGSLSASVTASSSVSGSTSASLSVSQSATPVSGNLPVLFDRATFVC